MKEIANRHTVWDWMVDKTVLNRINLDNTQLSIKRKLTDIVETEFRCIV